MYPSRTFNFLYSRFECATWLYAKWNGKNWEPIYWFAVGATQLLMGKMSASSMGHPLWVSRLGSQDLSICRLTALDKVRKLHLQNQNWKCLPQDKLLPVGRPHNSKAKWSFCIKSLRTFLLVWNIYVHKNHPRNELKMQILTHPRDFEADGALSLLWDTVLSKNPQI